ncbi:multiple epidermal growth factor-like domains protein 9 isoform X2 [Pseudoliparis swirei]|uniref:multiple epidermal growth factor-like domains protein 9 isoform X2 n=1 Tax=Pseudoliparis swirei TaxID=2059687 RepID=UPI0024BF0F7E|nr:multiple epidermal growth factor-like domains protein 9 isoform X2 [Pseudoliparis swirei]
MRLASLMMYISPPLIFILYVCVGRSDAAPHDASPLSGQPGAASLTWGSSLTDVPGPGPESRLAPGSLISLTPSPVIVSGGPTAAPPAAAFQPPPADPTTGLTPAAAKAQIPAPLPRSPGKRSTDARPSLLAPEKRLQTLGSAGSVVAQRTDNDAWAAADGTAGPAAASVESQEALCNCSSGAEGVLDPDECDRPSGQCSCVLGYTGLQCEDCEERHFTNGSSGCLPCACDSFGAVNPLCDSSGTCVCKTGVYGPKCDECHPGFFHFSSTGCRPCQCQSHSSSCLPQSGACMNCEGNTQGSNCEECKPGSYRGPGDAPTAACAPCPCSNATSTGTCHAGPGGPPRCDQCLPPYGGPHCDRCSAGFSKASGLCVPCDCSGNADPQGPPQLCDPDTGRCLRCSNSTTGAQCQLCAPGLTGDARAHNCTRPALRLLPTPALTPSSEAPHPSTMTSSTSTSSTMLTSATARGVPTSTSSSNTSTSSSSSSSSTTQALLTSPGGPTDNTTAALTEVSWTQFNIIILAVIILVVLVLLGFVGGVYTYREYQNRKLNAPFWTIELKEDNISFSSYHDSIPNADVSGLLEDEANEVAPNGQLALTTQGNCYKA